MSPDFADGQPMTRTANRRMLRVEEKRSKGESTMTWNRILITLDGSELAERAIAAALKIAAPGTKLHLLSVVETATEGATVPPMPIVSPANGGFATEYLAQNSPYPHAISARRDYLALVRDSLHEQGYEVTTEVQSGEVVHCINAVAASFDLLVMATHGRTGVGRMLFGSVTDTVLHHLPCPMLIVPAHGAPERIEAFEDKSKGYRCILVSLDGTPESEAILPLVETILAVKAATVVLMKTEPYVQFNTLKIGSDEYALINANAEMEARHYLEMIGDRLKAFGATPIVEVNFNNPQREIEVLSRTRPT
jgi:nucleotide-binding universal stress UspA family protein